MAVISSEDIDHIIKGNCSYLFLITRLLVNDRSTVLHGYLVDPSGSEVGRFNSLDQIPDMITDWLVKRRVRGEADS